MTLRRRFKQTQSLEERLAEEAKRLREEAKIALTWYGARHASAQSTPMRNRFAHERVAFIAGASTAKVGLRGKLALGVLF